MKKGLFDNLFFNDIVIKKQYDMHTIHPKGLSPVHEHLTLLDSLIKKQKAITAEAAKIMQAKLLPLVHGKARKLLELAVVSEEPTTLLEASLVDIINKKEAPRYKVPLSELGKIGLGNRHKETQFELRKLCEQITKKTDGFIECSFYAWERSNEGHAQFSITYPHIKERPIPSRIPVME